MPSTFEANAVYGATIRDYQRNLKKCLSSQIKSTCNYKVPGSPSKVAGRSTKDEKGGKDKREIDGITLATKAEYREFKLSLLIQK